MPLEKSPRLESRRTPLGENFTGISLAPAPERESIMTNVKSLECDHPLSIPDVVGRYLRYAIPGNGRIHRATVFQEGDFRLGTSGEHWRRFTATERFTVDQPGFEWDANIQMAPLLKIRVHDSYRAGVGTTSASLLGHRFLTARPATELNTGALQRYLAEAIWLPSALVAGNGVRWRSLDRDHAIATLRDGPLVVALQFSFNERGAVTEVFSPGRYRSVAGDYVATPWLVRCWDYVEIDGFRVPARAEVSWVLPDGLFTYWRGRVRGIAYEEVPAARERMPATTAQPLGRTA